MTPTELNEFRQLNFKLISLESRIAALEIQLRDKTARQTEVAERNGMRVPEPIASDHKVAETKIVEAPVENKFEVAPAAINSKAEYTHRPAMPQHTARKTEQSGGLSEKRIGKTVMSIAASVLIFVSFVCFGHIIQDNLTDAVKVCIMYGLSSIAAVFGLVKMRGESKYRILYTALAACGLGAFYITSLVSFFVFHQISEPVLLGIVGVWIILLIALSRHRSLIFTIICNIGIVIAAVLASKEWPSSAIGLALYAVTLGALYAVNVTKELLRDWWMLWQFPLVGLLLYATLCSSIASACLLAVVVILAVVWQLYHYQISTKDGLTFLIDSLISYFVLLVCSLTIDSMIPDEVAVFPHATFIILAIICIAWCVCYYKRFVSTNVFYLFYVVYIVSVVLLPQLGYGQWYADYVGYLLPVAVLLMLGIACNNRSFRYVGYFYLLIFVYNQPNNMPFAAGYLIYLCVFACMLVWTLRHYSNVDKYILTVVAVGGVLVLYHQELIDRSITYIIIVFISMFVNSHLYANKPKTNELEPLSRYIGYLFNAVVLLAGLVLINMIDAPIRVINVLAGSTPMALFLVMIMVIALSLVNTRGLYENGWNDGLVSIYIGLKFTIVILVIMCRMHALPFIISVIGIALAVLFVIFGFRFSHKMLRLYGLALSIVCVLKLALFDIDYTTTIMKPIGFFVAGVLCYSISWIYSRLKKNKS